MATLSTDQVSNSARPSTTGTREVGSFPGSSLSASSNLNERLFRNRSRMAAKLNTVKPGDFGDVDYLGEDLGGNRGQHAFIKILTSQTQASEYLSGNTKRKISSGGEFLGEGGLVSQAVSNDPSSGYDRFLVTAVSCNFQEKVQITEVFGDSEVVYYFGRHPMIFNIQGLLIDSPDNSWMSDWFKMYDDFLRGSQTAKNYELIKLVLPNMELEGTIMNFSYQQESSRDTDVGFSFQFLAKTVIPIPATVFLNEGMIDSARIASVNFEKASVTLSQAQINSQRAKVAALNSVLQNPASTSREKSAALLNLGKGVGVQVADQQSSVKSQIDGVNANILDANKAINSATNAVLSSSMFQTVTSSLEGIRANLFSPVYGVLSSLTKLVSNVFNSANVIFNNVVTPVKNILRDITQLGKKAESIVKLVNSSISNLGRNVTTGLKGVEDSYKDAIKSIGKAAGAIATAPVTAANSLKNMFKTGALSGNKAFLRVSPKLTVVRPISSTSGSGASPATKLYMLNSTPVYNTSSANTLTGTKILP